MRARRTIQIKERRVLSPFPPIQTRGLPTSMTSALPRKGLVSKSDSNSTSSVNSCIRHCIHNAMFVFCSTDSDVRDGDSTSLTTNVKNAIVWLTISSKGHAERPSHPTTGPWSTLGEMCNVFYILSCSTLPSLSFKLCSINCQLYQEQNLISKISVGQEFCQ